VFIDAGDVVVTAVGQPIAGLAAAHGLIGTAPMLSLASSVDGHLCDCEYPTGSTAAGAGYVAVPDTRELTGQTAQPAKCLWPAADGELSTSGRYRMGRPPVTATRAPDI